MRSLLVLAVLTALAGSAAAERFEIIDRGADVEVIAEGAVAAAGAQVSVVRERIEIPLASADRNSKRTSDDATVRLAEVRGRSERKLSIKLRPDHDGVVALSRGVSFVQVGNAVHVTIPRTPPPPAAVTPPAAPAIAAAAASAPPATVEAPTAPAPAPPIPAPPVAAPPVAAPAAAPPAALGTNAPRPTSGRWWMLLAGLVLVGGGAAAIIRKKRQAAPDLNQLEIIASRSLGGKSRIVWIAAGDRELVIAVSPQAIRPLGQWRRAAPPALGRGFDRELAAAERDLAGGPALGRGSSPNLTATRGAPAATPAAPAAGRASTSSPAVSGLLRLRERVATVNEDVATDDPDADEQWARDLLAAAGRR